MTDILYESVDGLGTWIDFFACPVDVLLRANIELVDLRENVRQGGLETRSRGLQHGQFAAGESEEGRWWRDSFRTTSELKSLVPLQ